jgi:hypothetical protein
MARLMSEISFHEATRGVFEETYFFGVKKINKIYLHTRDCLRLKSKGEFESEIENYKVVVGLGWIFH